MMIHRLAGCSAAVLLASALTFPAGLRGDCSLTQTGVMPLDDAGPRFYKGTQCGLYPRGGNSRPPALEGAARQLGAEVQPLDQAGVPNAGSGKIVMISIGMSNTTQEFRSGGAQAFQARAEADPAKNPRLVLVDGAIGGQDSGDWLDPNGPPWTTLETRLANSGVTAAQVQVAWLKHARRNPNSLGEFPAHAQTLASDLATIARTARARFPNLKLIYFASRTRAYTNVASSLNPEPFAFEGGFSVKWLIEDQIAGRGNLNWDPARGAVVAPLFLWGPYIWIDGTVPRSDGLTWLCSDLNADFTHPSPNGGVPKVATQLLAFFKTDATAVPWFLRSSVVGQQPILSADANVTSGNVPLTVQFTATATDPDGTISGYDWTFADGTSSAAQNPVKTFTAPGRYEARVNVTDNAGNTVQQSITIIARLALPQWREIYFTPAEIKNPQISGDLADPESDGLTNLAEYALGTNPKVADAPVFSTRTAGGQLTLTFPRAKYVSEAVITVEAASQPGGPWTSGPTVTAQAIQADDGVVQTIVATDLASGATTRFLRLRIDRSVPRPERATTLPKGRGRD